MDVTNGAAQAYFHRIDTARYRPTDHVSGAWNLSEQHVAPGIGLLTHAVEADHRARRAVPLQTARLSVDIWGTIPMDDVAVDVEVLRPGRTIELVEARLSHGGRVALALRAWLTNSYDSGGMAATPFPAMPHPDSMTHWDPTEIWGGGFIANAQVVRQDSGPGRARCWVRAPLALIAGEQVSATARFMTLADIANGLAPLASPEEAAFPNLDLTAHLFREPEGEWMGFDIFASNGSTGIGLTHSILHDGSGPLGVLSQSLTVRPRLP